MILFPGRPNPSSFSDQVLPIFAFSKSKKLPKLLQILHENKDLALAPLLVIFDT